MVDIPGKMESIWYLRENSNILCFPHLHYTFLESRSYNFYVHAEKDHKAWINLTVNE